MVEHEEDGEMNTTLAQVKLVAKRSKGRTWIDAQSIEESVIALRAINGNDYMAMSAMLQGVRDLRNAPVPEMTAKGHDQ